MTFLLAFGICSIIMFPGVMVIPVLEISRDQVCLQLCASRFKFRCFGVKNIWEYSGILSYVLHTFQEHQLVMNDKGQGAAGPNTRNVIPTPLLLTNSLRQNGLPVSPPPPTEPLTKPQPSLNSFSNNAGMFTFASSSSSIPCSMNVSLFYLQNRLCYLVSVIACTIKFQVFGLRIHCTIP